MMNKEFLYEMLRTPSVSGFEFGLQKKIARYMEDKGVSIRTDHTGNLVSYINGDSPFKVLLCGHVDEIGFRVTEITEQGYLRVTKVGGVPVGLAQAKRVTVMGKKDILGVMGTLGCKKDLQTKVEFKDLFVDCGFRDKADAEQFIRPGDPVVYTYSVEELQNDCITGRGLDNRLGAYAVTHALLRARELGAKVGVYAATTVGEETTMRGAYWSANLVKPTLAIAVDVTYASDYPGTDAASYGEVKIGGGPVISRCGYENPPMYRGLDAAAEKLGISVQYDVCGGECGTDGDVLNMSGEGIPTAVVSIPLRYMHGPSEVGSLRDLDQVVELLAKFLADLTEEFDPSPFH